jgi:transcriptional regulator with XRE-family HTH domain
MDTKGERLRHFAKFLSGTLAAFAEELGIAPSQLQNHITGNRFPKDDMLEKIAALGCNIHWLLTGEGLMFADNEAGRALQARQKGSNVTPIRSGGIENLQVIQSDDIAAVKRFLEKIEQAKKHS